MIRFTKVILIFFLSLLAVLILQINGLTCGGNCPSGACPTCPCGQSILRNNFCKLNRYQWKTYCCLCIVNTLTRSNHHFSNYVNGQFYLTQYGILESDLKWCKTSVQNACYTDAYADDCAYKLYVQAGNKWTYWKETAKACGCFDEENNEVEVVLNKKADKKVDKQVKVVKRLQSFINQHKLFQLQGTVEQSE